MCVLNQGFVCVMKYLSKIPSEGRFCLMAPEFPEFPLIMAKRTGWSRTVHVTVVRTQHQRDFVFCSQFSPSILSRPAACRVVLPTFRAGLPSLKMSSQTHTEGHSTDLPGAFSPIKLTVKFQYHHFTEVTSVCACGVQGLGINSSF